MNMLATLKGKMFHLCMFADFIRKNVPVTVIHVHKITVSKGEV